MGRFLHAILWTMLSANDGHFISAILGQSPSAQAFKMLQKAEGRVHFTKENLRDFGLKVNMFPGVEDWFERIREYGKESGVIIEHYIISSGLKEMIEGTSVAREGAFEKIYACSFYFDPDTGVAKWPAQVVNYTNKTQFLFRIEKGVLDINDPDVNEFYSPDKIRVPFRNIVYIGDSDTDIPCMKLVNTYGGHSIGVYNAETKDKAKVYKMMRDKRIKYFVSADYSEGKELDLLIKSIIDRTATNEVLESFHYQNENELLESDKVITEIDRKRMDLFIKLENSRNFVGTHLIINELNEYASWTQEEKDILFGIAIDNRQVFYILRDMDVKQFYKKLLRDTKSLNKNAQKVKEEIERE